MRLQGKSALVIGGGQKPGNGPVGNGRAVSLTYAREGATVMVADRDSASAEAVVAEIRAAGGEAKPITVDALVEDDLSRAVAETEAQFGDLDILHNNVGLSIELGDAPVTEIKSDVFDNSMALNLRSMVLASKHALPGMRARRKGVIINISSIAATETYPWVGYKLAKAGVLALTEQLAIQNAEYGIRCVSLAPGKIDTVMAVDARAKAWGKTREEVAAERAASIPLGRQGTAWDVANAALFMASDEASFISGVHLRIDGAAGCRVG